jgi:hypothetical protein
MHFVFIAGYASFIQAARIQTNQYPYGVVINSDPEE